MTTEYQNFLREDTINCIARRIIIANKKKIAKIGHFTSKILMITAGFLRRYLKNVLLYIDVVEIWIIYYSNNAKLKAIVPLLFRVSLFFIQPRLGCDRKKNRSVNDYFDKLHFG